jgi:gliding motility-associated-like protein
MPTAFTPNGDNQNDIFRMIKYNGTAATVGAGNVVTGGTVSVSSFEIFNRWGQIVFQTADDRTGWDGTYNGVPQDVGVYSYHIRYKCADGNFYEEKGDVTLIR